MKKEELKQLVKEFVGSYRLEIMQQMKDFATGGENRQIEEFKSRSKK